MEQLHLVVNPHVLRREEEKNEKSSLLRMQLFRWLNSEPQNSVVAQAGQNRKFFEL